jgi:hypothetical protein
MRRYNPHIVVTDTSWPKAECVVFYSRDLRRVHSVWIVPGTIEMDND